MRGGEEIVSVIDGEVERASASGAPILYTQDWHPASTPHFQKDGGVWPVHCVMDTWGAAFHPGLRVEGEVVRKGADGADGYSGFSVRDPRSGDVSATRLGSMLRAAGIEHIVLCGLTTDYCVVETALDARRLGFTVTVLSDAIRAVNLEPGDEERALDRIREAGVEVI